MVDEHEDVKSFHDFDRRMENFLRERGESVNLRVKTVELVRPSLAALPRESLCMTSQRANLLLDVGDELVLHLWQGRKRRQLIVTLRGAGSRRRRATRSSGKLRVLLCHFLADVAHEIHKLHDFAQARLKHDVRRARWLRVHR